MPQSRKVFSQPVHKENHCAQSTVSTVGIRGII